MKINCLKFTLESVCSNSSSKERFLVILYNKGHSCVLFNRKGYFLYISSDLDRFLARKGNTVLFSPHKFVEYQN